VDCTCTRVAWSRETFLHPVGRLRKNSDEYGGFSMEISRYSITTHACFTGQCCSVKKGALGKSRALGSCVDNSKISITTKRNIESCDAQSRVNSQFLTDTNVSRLYVRAYACVFAWVRACVRACVHRLSRNIKLSSFYYDSKRSYGEMAVLVGYLTAYAILPRQPCSTKKGGDW